MRSLRRSVHRINKSRRRQGGGKRSRQVGGGGCGGGGVQEAFDVHAAFVPTGGAKIRRRRRTRKH